MTTVEFLALFREFLGRNGWQKDSNHWTLIERWDRLVSNCVDCHRWNMYEFENDLYVRDLLQKAIEDDKLEGFPQAAEIKRLVGQVDDRFRQLLTEPLESRRDRPWWQAGLLARAGREYCEDALRMYGVVLDQC